MTHIQAKFRTTTAAHGRHRVTSAGSSNDRTHRPPTPRVPHVAKLMALAIRLDHLLAAGQVKDQAEIARTAGITRARVTQILNLTNLAPDLQQTLLDLAPTTDTTPQFREHELRHVASDPNWTQQRKAWKRLINQRSQKTPAESRSRAK